VGLCEIPVLAGAWRVGAKRCGFNSRRQAQNFMEGGCREITEIPDGRPVQSLAHLPRIVLHTSVFGDKTFPNEESAPMIRDPEELLFELHRLKLSARGRVALLMAAPVGMILLAIAWRIVWG
jgi:hypothetical protein